MSVAVTGQSETTRRDYATTARAFIGMVGRVLDQRAPSPVDVVDFFLGQHGRWSESTISILGQHCALLSLKRAANIPTIRFW